MKGAVFIALNEMIEKQFGMAVWESILDRAAPESEGIYASAGSYSDEEIGRLVGAAAEELKLPENTVTRLFGTYLFGELNSKFPIFASMHVNLFDFLKSIEGVIHKEVDKLYSDAALPEINCIVIEEKHLQMHYRSPRKLCFLAEGLILGAAQLFDQKIDLRQSQCTHDGGDACVIDVKLL